jgi:hypothetical protein
MREENLYTIAGLSGKAAETLWKLIKDDHGHRHYVLITITRAMDYYRALEEISNEKIRCHLMHLVMKESMDAAWEVKDTSIKTYFMNVLKQIYKKNLRTIR